jgi:glycerophosphoryl diester phosphodiesterase
MHRHGSVTQQQKHHAPRLPRGTFERQGHRGARGVLPENTLPGFCHAIAVGVDSLELDIAMTRDRQLVITHDPALNPDLVRRDGVWITEPIPIRDLTTAKLRVYDVGRLRPGSDTAARFLDQRPVDGTPIPSLTDLFALVEVRAKPSLILDIEIKTSPLDREITFPPEDITKALVAEIDRAGLRARTRIRSFDWRALARAAAIAPDIPRAALTSERLAFDTVWRGQPDHSPWLAGRYIDNTPGAVPRAVHHLGADVWAPDFRDLTPEALAEAHALDLKVIVWTVNAEGDIARMLSLGVDGLTTDFPDRLPDTCGQH